MRRRKHSSPASAPLVTPARHLSAWHRRNIPAHLVLCVLLLRHRLRGSVRCSNANRNSAPTPSHTSRLLHVHIWLLFRWPAHYPTSLQLKRRFSCPWRAGRSGGEASGAVTYTPFPHWTRSGLFGVLGGWPLAMPLVSANMADFPRRLGLAFLFESGSLHASSRIRHHQG